MNLRMIGAGVAISAFALGVSAETLELAIGETRTIDSAASYAEGLSVSVAPETYLHEAYLTGSNTLVLPGAKLADYEFHSAGLRIHNPANWALADGIVTNVAPKFVARTADKLVGQFQYYAGDVWPRVRCAKVEMAETPEGLVARIDYVRYSKDWLPPADGLAGVDFDTTTIPVDTPNMATSDDGVAIGVKTLTLRKIKTESGRLIFTKPVDFGTGLAIGDNAIVELQGEAAGSAPSVLAGTGDLVVGPYASRVEDVKKPYSGNVLSTWTVLASGLDCTLAELTGIEDVTRRASGNPAQVYFFANNGALATCQVQSIQGDYNRCAFVELKQDGDAIMARLAECYYGWGAARTLGVDFRSFAALETKPYGVIDPAWAAGLSNSNDDSIGGLSLVFANKRVEARVRFDDVSGLTGTVALKTGAVLLADAQHAAPNLVLDGGALKVSGTVRAGTLALASDSTLSLAEGATVAFADSAAQTWTAEAKLSVLGDFVEGSSVRFGTSVDALTRDQRAQVSLNGLGAKLSAGGYLLKATGLVLLFR